MRDALSLVAGALVAGAAGLLLGEYSFDGWAIIGAGIVLGLFVSEATTSVARRRSTALAVGGAVLTVAGLLLAAWIATSHRFSTLELHGWAAVVAGAVAAGLRAAPFRARSRNRPADQEPAG